MPAEPRALRRDHQLRQEWPASLGREPEPGMLGHEKSADRPALTIIICIRLITFTFNPTPPPPPFRGQTSAVLARARSRATMLRRTAHEKLLRKKTERCDRYLPSPRANNGIFRERANLIDERSNIRYRIDLLLSRTREFRVCILPCIRSNF